ncbi:MAG: hypothetical protein KBS81_10955 [Spirochaetales bacterium]|nr:hypothetical protein [Candidatus Physcosoma equi]
MNNGKKLFGTFCIPVLTFGVVLVLCLLQRVALFDGALSWQTFFRAVVNVALVTYALSINLNSGRFDFSIGSVALLSSVVSATLSIKLGLGPVPMLFLSLVIGLLLGLFSGTVYVLVKLPPIIVSLAMALFYEGCAYVVTGGHGVSFVTNTGILAFANTRTYLVLIVCATVLMVLLFDHTRFGYEYKALQSGQKVSVSTGIREIPNALCCYSIAGALMGVQGFVSATNNGTIQMALNFGSIGPMFMGFLPMFVGGFIAKFSNDKLGYLLGAVSSAFISLLYVRLNVSSSTQQIISACLLVGFLIYLNNEGKLKKLFRTIQ